MASCPAVEGQPSSAERAWGAHCHFGVQGGYEGAWQRRNGQRGFCCLVLVALGWTPPSPSGRRCLQIQMCVGAGMRCVLQHMAVQMHGGRCEVCNYICVLSAWFGKKREAAENSG